MMLSPSPSLLARSSLEEMLESLRQRDGEEKPKDLPPALPARPTSRARLPSARRSLPSNLKVGDDHNSTDCLQGGLNAKEETNVKDSEVGHRRKGSFESKKMKRKKESPYMAAIEENVNEELPQDLASEPAASPVSSGKDLVWDDNISYFMQKVTWD